MTISAPKNYLENTFISGEKVDNISLIQEVTPEREQVDESLIASSNLHEFHRPSSSSSQPFRNVKPASH